MRLLGYEPIIFAMETPRYGHAVCAFKKDGYFFYFDNTTLRITSAETPADMAVMFYRKYHFTKLMFLDSQTKAARLYRLGSP